GGSAFRSCQEPHRAHPSPGFPFAATRDSRRGSRPASQSRTVPRGIPVLLAISLGFSPECPSSRQLATSTCVLVTNVCSHVARTERAKLTPRLRLWRNWYTR